MSFTMKKLIRNILVITLLLLFLAATSGVSLFVHTCMESNRTDLLVFPELTGHTAGCGCMDEITRGDSDIPNHEVVRSPECCRSVHLLIKMSYTGVQGSWQGSVPVDLTILPHGQIRELPEPENTCSLAGYILWLDHSPPPGNSRIYLYHQIRIPDPVC